MSGIRLVHGFTHFQGLGGVQSMLQLHHRADAIHGLDSRFLAYFEPPAVPGERVSGLGLTGRHSIRAARSRFAAAAEATAPPPDVFAFHNLWGLPFFAGLDRTGRRLGVLHTDFPGLEACLPGLTGLLDGLLCVSRPLLDRARRRLPELDGPRSDWLPYPVARDTTQASQAPLHGRPLVLGFAGRLSFAQKRVDRFPPLVRQLHEAGLDFRFEFLGDGPQAGWLRQQIGDNPRVRFHGRLSGEAYWEALKAWDVMVFVTDYEGLPISLLEALSVGVLPLFPAVGCGGDAYAAGVRDDLLYPAGDLAAAVHALRRLAGATEEALRSLRARANALAQPHLGDGYLRTFAEAVRRVVAQERLSAVVPAARPVRVQDHLPFGILRRLSPASFWWTPRHRLARV